MAGSRRWFLYKDDSGTDYSVNLDESNSEATVGGVRLFLNRTIANPLLRKGIKLRYVNAYLQSNPLNKRKFAVGNPLAIPQILAGATITASVYGNPEDGVDTDTFTWVISSYRGEQSSIPPAVSATSGDSGLVDGDQPQDAG
jgi:hypothetical protein